VIHADLFPELAGCTCLAAGARGLLGAGHPGAVRGGPGAAGAAQAREALAGGGAAEPGRFLSLRGRFAQEGGDFAIVDDEYRIVALVELDDSTHDADRDAERDRMTGMAGYLTIRYDSRDKPEPEEIREDFWREGLLD
jgi:hypothetical protein